jgi:large repetitive protein
MGGESAGGKDTFYQNEEYDPASDKWVTLEPMKTPRQGAVAGTIGGSVYVAGGGTEAGTSFSDINEAFAP